MRNIVGLFESEKKTLEQPLDKVDDILYIKSSQIKFDRTDLFENVPVFTYPMIDFNEDKGKSKLWRNIQQALMSVFPEEKRRFIRMIEASHEMVYNESEKLKEEDFPRYVKNKCHKFPFYVVKMTRTQYDLLVREGFIDGKVNETEEDGETMNGRHKRKGFGKK